MSLSAPEIAKVLGEIAPVCAGAYVNRIRFQHGTDLLLDLRNGRERPTLLVSVHPRVSRLGFVPRPGGTGEEPGGFLQLLRARMEGARLFSIEQVSGDRIVRLRGGSNVPLSLVAELMGARSNLYLLDADDRVEGAFHSGGTRVGETWTAPPAMGEPPGAARKFDDVEGESYCARIENFYAADRPRA